MKKSVVSGLRQTKFYKITDSMRARRSAELKAQKAAEKQLRLDHGLY